MVLYKRKMVEWHRPPPLPQDLDTPAFVIPQTGEWFLSYLDYLHRMDYYNTRKFVCEITGNSCLTFFEAGESEMKEIKGVEKNFPDALREHMLRYLQFNRITRLDHLTDNVYLSFKTDFFPGEIVYIRPEVAPQTSAHAAMMKALPLNSGSSDSSRRLRGVIREKVQYGNTASTRYLVLLLSDGQQFLVFNDGIVRDRNQYTKWLVKTFIKLTMTRLHKVGAPWVVKQKYATRYRIQQTYPDDLKQFQDSTPSGELLFADQIKRLKRSAPPKNEEAMQPTDKPSTKKQKRGVTPSQDLKSDLVDVFGDGDDKSVPSHANIVKSIVDDALLVSDVTKPWPKPSLLVLPGNVLEWMATQDKKPEDTRVAAVLESLQCWSFLNVYHTVLKLDTFTFDDFVYAMGWSFTQYDELGRCELLDEIWCAVLSAIVLPILPTKEEAEDAANRDTVFGLNVTIPASHSYIDESSKASKTDEASDHEESMDGIEVKSQDTAEAIVVDLESPKIAVAKDFDNDGCDSDAEESRSDKKNSPDHNAYTVMNYRKIPWHERLRRRNFKEGAWQSIMLGVLSLVEDVPAYNQIITRVFRTLCPPDSPPTLSTVLTQFYRELDFDTRMQTLNILTELVASGSLVRTYIDECLETTTKLRRARLECIREYRAHLENARRLNSSIHDIMHLTERDETKSDGAAVVKRIRLNYHLEMSPEESAMAATNPDLATAWREKCDALVKMEELHKQQLDIERDLNGVDCQRIRYLGRDRFFNRYWWFERNGLPPLVDELNVDDETEPVGSAKGNNKGNDNADDSEKREAAESANDHGSASDYLMGRIWVQGPSQWDLERNLASVQPMATSDISLKKELLPKQEPNEAGSPPLTQLSDRKLEEERDFPLIDGSSWGYYDQLDQVSELCQWLAPRGARESQLLKEITAVENYMRLSISARRRILSLDKVPTEEAVIAHYIANVDERATAVLELESTEHAGDTNSDDDMVKAGTRNRSSHQRRPHKPRSVKEALDFGNAEELAGWSLKLKEDLDAKLKDRDFDRVVDWVNEIAREQFGKPLYEGGGKPRAKYGSQALR